MSTLIDRLAVALMAFILVLLISSVVQVCFGVFLMELYLFPHLYFFSSYFRVYPYMIITLGLFTFFITR